MAEHNHFHSDGDSRQELIALVNYMVKHNVSHTAELEELAKKLEKVGDKCAVDEINQAVVLYKQGNDKLSQALDNLK